MKRSVFFLSLLILGFNLFPQESQRAYTLDLRRDITLSVFSAGLFFGQFFLDDSPKIPANLNRSDVNILDRGLMFDNRALDVSIYALPVLNALPIIVHLTAAGWDINNNWDKWLTYGTMYTQTYFLTLGTRGLLKGTIDRYRPRDYFRDTIDRPIPTNSFPSGSTTIAFMPATFLSVTFSAEYPDSPWKIPVIVGSYTVATAVGVIRILSGAHFLTDVLAGAAIGSFFGWLVPTLHKNTGNDSGAADSRAVMRGTAYSLSEGFQTSGPFIGNGIIFTFRF